MIKLYSFGENFSVIDPSPFVLKVDAYLRMANIEYETIASMANLKKAPKGKLPFIDDNGVIISDSQLIIEHLKQHSAQDLDRQLTAQQRAICYLVTKSLDENLYFILVYSRWCRDDSWPLIKQAFFGQMPFPIKQIVPNILRKKVIKGLHGQGLGRHSNSEIQQMLKQNLQSLSDLLADKQYFIADKPCSLDASAFAFLAAFILVDLDNPYNQIARQYSNLVDYCNSIQQRYY
ncbi:MAG: hypothetical protein OFPI_43020 [Osedax symbiont Rs2]|nr:MAG: hypothetical protein OFPI_43020 [Osedax symbiont Rs2]